MMDDLAGVALPQGEVERLEHQLRAQMGLHRPAHNLTLYYQTIPPYYLRQRAEDATGIDTRRLQFYARNLVVKGTPVDGWRLMIANDSMNVQ